MTGEGQQHPAQGRQLGWRDLEVPGTSGTVPGAGAVP